jgi:hypothetical protein
MLEDYHMTLNTRQNKRYSRARGRLGCIVAHATHPSGRRSWEATTIASDAAEQDEWIVWPNFWSVGRRGSRSLPERFGYVPLTVEEI